MDFNYIDLIIAFLLVYFVWQGYQTGLLGGLFNIVSTIVSFVLAIVFYPQIGSFLRNQLSWSENLALVIAFFVILIVAEVVFSFLFSRIFKLLSPAYKRIKGIRIFDKVLGIIPAVLSGLFLISLFLLLPLILPVKESFRQPITDSAWNRLVLSRMLHYQPQIEGLLTRLPYKNLAYLITPGPLSKETIELNFPKEIKLVPDPESENAMLNLVNIERKKQCLKLLVPSNQIRKVARAHCLDMFARGYFSHYSPEGVSPFDRMDRAGIKYGYAGENLAYAPNVTVAHQGLMDSKGHRENILRVEYGHLGVGVIDGGINGKMFCQEFTD